MKIRRPYGTIPWMLSLLLIAAACSGPEAGNDPADGGATASPADAGQGDDATDDSQTEEGTGTFYESSDTIELVIPLGPGGGTDRTARFYANYFSENLPGNPNVQPVNIEGAGGVLGANEWFQRFDRNGMSAFTSSASQTYAYLLGDPGVEYDYANMTPVLGVPNGAAILMSSKYADHSPQELTELDEPILIGASGQLGANTIDAVALELLGYNHRFIWGYEGSGAIAVAFESGEVEAYTPNAAAYLTTGQELIDAGAATPMLSHGQVGPDGDLVRDPFFPDVPTVKELYEEIYGEAPSGPAWNAYVALQPGITTLQKSFWVHGDAPEDAVVAWNQGAEAIATNDDIAQEAEEAIGPYPLVYGDALQAVAGAVLSMDDETQQWILDFMVETHGAPDPRT